jgi:hypothetical protein
MTYIRGVHSRPFRRFEDNSKNSECHETPVPTVTSPFSNLFFFSVRQARACFARTVQYDYVMFLLWYPAIKVLVGGGRGTV